MSMAIARANSPTASTSADQSSDEPGLPWTNTTASLASSGPASSIGVVIPSTVMRRALGTSAGYRRCGAAQPLRGAAAAQVYANHARHCGGVEHLLRRDPALAHQHHALSYPAVA